jgi:hypothetical protein
MNIDSGGVVPADIVSGDEARLFQPAQRDVNVAGIETVPQRPEHPVKPGAELEALRGLLGKHRQHDFLLHAIPPSNG